MTTKPKHPPGPPMTLGNMCGRGMHYLIGSCLVLILSLSLLNSHANTKVISEKDQEAARAAWAKAVSLAQERNSDRICESEAYQSTIILELSGGEALPYLKNEVVQGKSDSVKTLQQALAGNLMLSDVIGKMSTPKQVAKAIVGSVWYSADGGAAGSSSILEIEKNYVRELVVDPETFKRSPVIWTYSFNATTKELTLRRGTTTRHYKLGRVHMEYGCQLHQRTG
jgi:hypothetical protein